MTTVEINFDGLIGPTHNYAGLSLGNVASAANAGEVSAPRQASLQGLAKMKRLMDLGIPQGVLPPQERPHVPVLRALGFDGSDSAVCAAAWAADPALFRNAFAASAMWTANAATVSPKPDTADGRIHLTVANLASMAHRSLEAPETEQWLRLAFSDEAHFCVHPPLRFGVHFGDEGAANHMRLAPAHGAPGVEVFVYGEDRGGRFPARQRRRASEAVARLHGLDPKRTLFVAQSDAAIQAGAFHNDVVAVANEHVLFAHEHAFEDKGAFYAALEEALPGVVIIEVPANEVGLEDAIRTYLFNSQLISLPPEGREPGSMALVMPQECRENQRVWSYVEKLLAADNPIREAIVIDVRESMRNGGGPACLRLRVQADAAAFAAIDRRFLLDEALWERLCRVVERHWPERITASDIGNPALWDEVRAARRALLTEMRLA